MIEPRSIHPDITVLATFHDLPGIGQLTINSFVLHAEQPMIIDTGTRTDTAEMVAALSATVDTEAARWLWITHTDADHTGSVAELLDTFPNLSVVTT